ncbi:uncharacterized protein LOC134775811 [Penaeus indicus]|uniref:uncharacterized protein LOC134775811 n=1 Tax=Penaeus indicus TaxID=29960 RepID=UPI00300C724A
MRDEGVIEPSSSPWLSPVVLVRKKNGTTRFCIDFRGLNAVTVAVSYPMPRVDELIDELRDTFWFTVLDAKNRYWSISVAPDRPKTAFSDGHRPWQFRRLPFGLATALSHPRGILPDPAKVIAINNMSVPRTVKEVRRFLGCSGYFRKHIPHAAVAAPLTRLTRPETRYPAIDIEALAVIEGVRAFDHYLYGNKFLIFTDHTPLTFVFHRRTKSPRMSKWSYELSNYQYKFLYKKGSSNHVPDCLSHVANIDASALDPQNVRDAQLKDPLWREVIRYLEEKAVPRRKLPLPLEEFELINGILYHVRHLLDLLLHQLVIPRELRRPDSLCVRVQYASGARDQAPMANAPDVHVPLERISADLIDLHSSTSGNQYVLSIVDHLTRYLQLIPLPCKSAETVAEAFINNFVTIFGPQRVIQTDNGSEFCNRLFKQSGKRRAGNSDGEHQRTADLPHDWSSRHFPLGPTNDVTIAADSAKRFQERLQVASSVAVKTSRRARESWARIYNKRVRKHFQPNVGVLVWVKVHPGHRRGPGRALADRWRGPALRRVVIMGFLYHIPREIYDYYIQILIKSLVFHAL